MCQTRADSSQDRQGPTVVRPDGAMLKTSRSDVGRWWSDLMGARASRRRPGHRASRPDDGGRLYAICRRVIRPDPCENNQVGKHTNRATDKQTDGADDQQTDSAVDKQTGKAANIHTERQVGWKELNGESD